MTIWTNEGFAKGQLPSMGESMSRSLDAQLVEHIVITGMPDTSMPMMMIGMRCFLVIFIYYGLFRCMHERLPQTGIPLHCSIPFSKAPPLYPHCGTKSRIFLSGDVFFSKLLWPFSSGCSSRSIVRFSFEDSKPTRYLFLSGVACTSTLNPQLNPWIITLSPFKNLLPLAMAFQVSVAYWILPSGSMS